jgi:hypothetical protein
MQQRNEQQGMALPVRRRRVLHPVYALYHRSYWASAGRHGANTQTLFNASSAEAHFATQLLRESLPSAHVLSVQRVENGAQHDAFLRRRGALMAELATSGTAWSEEAHARWLFHGTADAAVDQIVGAGSPGFDCSSPMRNGRHLGHGVYLAAEARRAHLYAAAAPAPGLAGPAHRRLLLCRALVGRACQGRADMRAPPPGGHSLCDFPRAPAIFVVPGAQACAAFVVRYALPGLPHPERTLEESQRTLEESLQLLRSRRGTRPRA